MTDVYSSELGGQWAVAVIMIVIASWILYRFLVPTSFKEWRNAGLAQGWRQIYLAQKQGQLVTSGLYRYMRHPQYTGIFLALIGQLVHWPTVPTLFLFPVIIWAYLRLAKREEERMIRLYSADYRNYMDEVPRFFPGKRQWREIANEI